MSLFQNPVGFETSSWKNRQKPGFSSKSKETVPKAEVLEQFHILKGRNSNLSHNSVRLRIA
ncbi:MAG: hypothetical protein LBE10_12305, partial [Treponema sp.]|nr:hypothetical protein [Treponema sp.]